MVLSVFMALIDFVSQGSIKWRSRQPGISDNKFMPAPLGHLGDVRVKIQVDVDVETPQEMLK